MRKEFVLIVIAVLISALIQFCALSMLKDKTPFEQTVVLFYLDLAIGLTFKKINFR